MLPIRALCYSSVMKRYLLALLLPVCLLAQTPPVTSVPEPANLGTLRALVETMASLRTQLETQNRRLQAGENEGAKEAAKKEVEALQGRLNQAQRDFETIATGLEVREFDQRKDNAKFDLTSEFTELLEPLVHELKSATEQPRVIEQLRGDLAFEQRRAELAAAAVRNAEQMLAVLPKKPANGSPEAALIKTLQSTLEKWRNHLLETEGSVKVLDYRLKETLAKRKTIVQLLSQATGTFFLSRWWNVVLAVLVAFGVFASWRALQRWLFKRLPWNANDPQRPFVARVVDIAFHVFAFVLSTLGVLTVFYARGDWLLLGLSLIALLALVLAAKNGLPRFYRQARLLMNLGEVREGERLVINGIPWQVKAINMFTELTNPALKDSVLRLPITQLVGMNSHPHIPGDPWFPCKEGDWVLLSDGTFGKVVNITPEFVQLVQLGGAFRTYTTQRFLLTDAVCLTGGFRVATVVSIDRSHQPQALEIAEALKDSVHAALASLVDAAQVRSVKAEYRGTPGLAMEFEITSDFDGSVAEKFTSLQRVVQSRSLEVCNAHGWRVGG